MKRLIIPILSIFYILTVGCHIKGYTADNTNKSRDTLSIEDFDSFKSKFYSDSIFQISRIIFPFESEKKLEKEYFEALKDSNINEVSKNNHTSYDKSDWIIMTDDFFKDDSIAIIDGVKYKRRFYKTNKFVEENILYADPEQVMIIAKFQLINNKWYMVNNSAYSIFYEGEHI